ncbi:complement C1q subcomponent subunit B-like [Mercenaria mercenaria]|uniref:complement C1q subcomponent subunit B-like n=1 Tax=Mercenaria mercenaria TaxID=6596 RepID=UPI00234E7A02|nr:complement C1q subcomponent subunit B-like [Mercenaria mercenaria]
MGRVEAKMEKLDAELKKPDAPIIAFNGYRTEGGDCIKDKAVVLPHVLLNEGSGYNPNTGYFTAPVAGLYHFTAHVCQFGGQFMAFSIVQGDKIIALSTVYEDRDNSCSSASAPAKLEIGERVNVQSTYNASRLFSNTHRWPSFTGYLVRSYR